VVSPQHIVILLILGVLLFGRRLPEVGRSLGKTIGELKRGLNGIENELRDSGGNASPRSWRPF
jgi:sec-independent protein translocase protein TatA